MCTFSHAKSFVHATAGIMYHLHETPTSVDMHFLFELVGGHRHCFVKVFEKKLSYIVSVLCAMISWQQSCLCPHCQGSLT
jgi:hypothetical protein